MLLTGKIRNLTELKKFSKILTKFLQPDVYLILQGELGTGKTTLVQFIAKNLGIKETVNSPTFTIFQQYQIKDNYHLNHFDFFRLKTYDNIDFFQELTIDNLNIIEWGEKKPQFWQNKKYIHLELIKQNSRTRLVNLNIPFLLNKKTKSISKNFLRAG